VRKGEPVALTAATTGKCALSKIAKLSGNSRRKVELAVEPLVVGVRSQAKIRCIAFIHIPRQRKDKRQLLSYCGCLYKNLFIFN
jgi:hypothetical protein